MSSSNHLIVVKEFILATFFLFSSPYYSFSQSTISVHGQIIDHQTLHPIPYAHINLQNTGIGTITNSEGKFAFTISERYRDNELKISCIGYKSKLIAVPQNTPPPLVIRLEEDLTVLNTVLVFPDDKARKMVERAIESIPQNYSVREEKFQGFTREIVASDSNFIYPYYIVEAALEVEKAEYSRTAKTGNVKLLKGRKHTYPGFEELDIRFYGGVHDAHQYDFVAQREGPLNRKSLNHYFFEIEDTLQHDGANVLVVSFESDKRLLGAGRLFILENSHALIKGEYSYQGERPDDLLNWAAQTIRNYNRLYWAFTTEYMQTDSVYRLKYTEYRTAFEYNNGEKKIFLKSLFSTTDVQPSPGPIPYPERTQYRDIFIESFDEYDPGFWEGYNVVVNDAAIQNIPPENWGVQNRKTKTDRLIEVISRIKLNYGVSYFRSDIPGTVLNFSQPDIELSANTGSTSLHTFGLTSRISYELNNHWIIGIENIGSLSAKRFSGNWLTLVWEKNLLPSGRPLYLNLGIKTGYFKHRYSLAEYENENGFSIGRKKFNADRVDVYFESRAFDVSPVATLLLEKSNGIRFFGEVSYSYAFAEKQGLYFREKNTFFKTTGFLENPSSEPFVQTSDKVQYFKNNLVFTAGCVFTF